jgi:truncated hemoglobin YjbI
LLEQALDKKVTITEGEKRRTLTLFAAGIEQFVRQYVKGDHRARKELFALAPQVGLDLLGLQKKALEEALPAHHQAMLYEYVEKQYDLVAQRPPVLAPPALLDDDNEGQS